MLNPSNPLAQNFIDNDIHNAEVYGIDPEGPSPFENSDNNVVIPELNLNRDIRIIWQFVSEGFGLLAPSTQMGVDISIMVKENVFALLSGESMQAGGKTKLYFSRVLKELKEKYNVISR